MNPIFNFIPEYSEFIRNSAEFIAESAKNAVESRGRFTIALSGGSTPRPVYELLTQSPYREMFPWRRTHFFWGDERCVKPDHKESNFRMANEAMLSRAPVPQDNIHRIQAEWRPPSLAVERYKQELESIVDHGVNQGPPCFDLILLGMGRDGHTASLFPKSPHLKDRSAWMAVESDPSLSPRITRITFTLPIINAARRVLFLVAAQDKEETLSLIVRRPEKARQLYPAAMVQPVGDLVWNIQGKKP